MIEFHGWITLRESLEEIDSGRLSSMVNDINTKIVTENYNFEIQLKYFNASCQMWVSGNSNHRTPEFDRLIELIEYIASTATGSYGLVHYWDDEDPEHSNEFQVYAIRRGSIVKELDKYLSPCVPVIEEEG